VPFIGWYSTRSTIESVHVILVEGTSQVKILIPVIVTVVVARYVGDLISNGLYEIAME
jgi:H+/Cl- antiporter ClcA